MKKRAERLPRVRGRRNRPRSRGLLRSLLLAGLVTVLVPAITVTGPGRASASSAAGILNNAWIITALGGEALSQQAELSPYEKGLATTATTGTVATTGLTKVPKAGALGMVLNTVGVLGGLAFAFGGGDDEPTLPAVVPGTAPTNGDPSCAMWTGLAGYFTGCQASSGGDAATKVNLFRGGISGFSRVGLYAVSGPAATAGAGYCTTSSLSSPSAYNGVQRDSRWEYRGQTGGSNCTALQTAGQYVVLAEVYIAPFGGTVDVGTEDPAAVPRYVDSFANCRTPGGGFETITDRVGPFFITPGAPWSTPEVPDLTCPTGTILESGGRELATEGTTETVQLQEPYTAPPWVIDQALTFPECYPMTEVRCTLAVYRTAPAPAIDCGAYSIGSANPCADWWSDPQRSTRYECRFGTEVVAMKRCKPYADTFSVGVVAPSDPEPDGEVTDPTPGVDPTPEQTPDLGGCVPNWGVELLNPWWVFKAQACALKWAFVPNLSTWDIAELKAQLEARPPFSIVLDLGTMVVDVGTAFSSAGGCGLLTDFSSTGVGAIDAPITCADVRDSIPAFSVWYTIVQAALWLGWGIYVWRSFSTLLERGN